MLDELRRLLPDDSVYPTGVVVPVWPRVMGRSFFPGGCGLAGGVSGRYPPRPIILVGQDFGTRTYWEQDLTGVRLDLGEGDSEGTWKGIRALSDERLLDLGRCFFTNALLGVRDNIADPTVRITGAARGLKFPAYVEASLSCLESQVELLRPTVVVALGIEPTTLLVRRWGLVPPRWRGESWDAIDGAGLQFRTGVLVRGREFAFAACVHPCMGKANWRYRRWTAGNRPLEGAVAQRAIWSRVSEYDNAVRDLRSE